MACVVKVTGNNLFSRMLYRNKLFCLKSLSTSSVRTNKDKLITTQKENTQHTYPPDFSKPLENKNWVSYGFDAQEKQEDNFAMHIHFFLLVSVCIVFGGFLFMYYPDVSRVDWARREAFIRLYEREMLGLDPIDPNYVDPEKIVLPSDEELGDIEIII